VCFESRGKTQLSYEGAQGRAAFEYGGGKELSKNITKQIKIIACTDPKSFWRSIE